MKPIFKLLLSSLLLISCAIKSPVQKPNILFVLVDDLGIKDLGFTGSDYHNTPNIDKLASNGFVFTQGYAGSRVCSPSRATIMTGKFSARHGITDWIGAKSDTAWRQLEKHDKMLPAAYNSILPMSEITFPEALQANGYKTFFAGKWHLGNEGSYPENHGFDINIGGYHSGSPRGGFFSPYNNPKLDDGKKGENLSERLAHETANFIVNNKDKPFFAMLSFYAVHAPIQTTKQKWQYYQAKAKAEGVAERGFTMERKLPIRQTQDNPIYGGLVESMDDAVGIVLKALEDNGLKENTIVVFTSDNGGVASGDAFSTSNLPYRGGKGYQWEGGIRAPYLIYVPWQNSNGKTSTYPVTSADLYPTLLDYANINVLPNQHQDGISLKPIIDQNETLPERPLYWHYPHYGNQGGDPSSVIRLGKWKLIHYYETGQNELYNLEEDVSEQHNLVESFPEIASKLHEQLKNWLDCVGAQYPVPDDQFDPTQREAYDQNIINTLLPKLEAQRLKMLSDDFEPNPTWWGSTMTKD